MNIGITPKRKLGLLLLGFAFTGALSAEGFVTREEVIAGVFPGAEIHSQTLFLTPTQQREAAKLSGVEIPTTLFASYTISSNGRVLGRAYVDTHVVKTKRESLLIILDAAGLLLRIETTASLEGPEHQAPRSWYQQYEGKQLSEDLYINRAIRPIAGATLTAQAANQAARRILAIDSVLSGARENP